MNMMNMIYKIVVTSIILLFFVGAYFGKAREAMLILFPIIIKLNYFQLRTSHKDQEVSKDLKLISILRGNREAFAWGYIILFILAISWIFLVAMVAINEMRA